MDWIRQPQIWSIILMDLGLNCAYSPPQYCMYLLLGFYVYPPM